MSAVTLESLLADLEAHRSAAKEWLELGHGTKHWYDEWDRHVSLVTKAYNMYIIGRDHGLPAAMLFKLSDGAVDPRVAR